MSELGVRFYEGPSLLTGDPIVGVLTGLDKGSHNAKTGAIAQAWILRSDQDPNAAVRANADDAICGDCSLRGDGAFGRTCYVTFWQGPLQVYKQLKAYPSVTWPELQAVLEGRSVRLGAYGDPAAIGFEVWRALLQTARGWIGYTHQWRNCDARFKTILMASVDSEDEFHAAHLAGWRTFRVRGANDPLLIGKRWVRKVTGVPLEFVCPASDEAGHRTTCERCQLCRGTSSPARSVVIVAHGKNGNKAAFYRQRSEALA